MAARMFLFWQAVASAFAVLHFGFLPKAKVWKRPMQFFYLSYFSFFFFSFSSIHSGYQEIAPQFAQKEVPRPVRIDCGHASGCCCGNNVDEKDIKRYHFK